MGPRLALEQDERPLREGRSSSAVGFLGAVLKCLRSLDGTKLLRTVRKPLSSPPGETKLQRSVRVQFEIES